MNGVHYSHSVLLALGKIITSEQTQQQTYKLVWDQFKTVADELGVYFPNEFGYAYPKLAEPGRFTECATMLVEAPDDKVTRGNIDYSVYHVMAYLGQITNRKLPLAERLEQRAAAIRDRARKYFTELDDESKIEMISDQWAVVGYHKVPADALAKLNK